MRARARETDRGPGAARSARLHVLCLVESVHAALPAAVFVVRGVRRKDASDLGATAPHRDRGLAPRQRVSMSEP